MAGTKLLLNNKEAYVEIGSVSFDEGVVVHWMSNGVYKVIGINNLVGTPGVAGTRYEYIKYNFEVLDLNGFDYSVAQPDYSVIQKSELSKSMKGKTLPEGTMGTVDAEIRLQTVISHLFYYIVEDIIRSEESDFGQNAENVLNIDNTQEIVSIDSVAYNVYKPIQLVQPIGYGIDFTNESAPGASDGVINVVNAWGGDSNIEYDFDSSGWQSNDTVTNLAPGEHTIQIRDGVGNTSGLIAVTIEEGV